MYLKLTGFQLSTRIYTTVLINMDYIDTIYPEATPDGTIVTKLCHSDGNNWYLVKETLAEIYAMLSSGGK